MIAGVSITTLLLVLVAGIGAGFVGYAVGASSLISYTCAPATIHSEASPTGLRSAQYKEVIPCVYPT